MSDFEFDYEQEIARLKAENNRIRAELTSLRRQADISERAANGFYAHAAAMELQRDTAERDLARALPVVEAAGVLVERWGHVQPETKDQLSVRFRDLLDALARAYRAARGEQP